MSLFIATLLVGALLLLLGTTQLIIPEKSKSLSIGMLRSKPAAVIFLGLATAWFLWEIWHLGEPDFGNHKNKLFWGFLIVSVLSYYHVPDFLSIRGLAALLLLSSDAVLDAAYMQEPISRLYLVGFIYLVIVCCMYLGSLPYRLRDFFTWIYKNDWRPRILSIALIAYGGFLTIIAFSY